MAAGQVMAGQSDMAVGGGVESMSRVPMFSAGGAWASDPDVAFKTYFVPQGISADLLATRYGFGRDDVDAYAVESQRRAADAWERGRFAGSVVPVKDRNGLTVLDRDEHMRPDTSMQSLAALEPSFAALGGEHGFDDVAIQRYPDLERIGTCTTPATRPASSTAPRGAGGQRRGRRRRRAVAAARIRAFSSIGSEPTIMLTGPAAAAEKALARAGMTADDIDLWELNEAFAAVVLRFMDKLGVDRDRINVNGGAIAMGHPLGATGR